MLRQIGNRIGREISFSLRGIEHDIEFLDEMMDWWEYAGLGKLEYDVDPTFHVRVGLPPTCRKSRCALPMWEMDDGIIEGALQADSLKIHTSQFKESMVVVTQKICGTISFTTNQPLSRTRSD